MIYCRWSLLVDGGLNFEGGMVLAFALTQTIYADGEYAFLLAFEVLDDRRRLLFVASGLHPFAVFECGLGLDFGIPVVVCHPCLFVSSFFLFLCSQSTMTNNNSKIVRITLVTFID